MAGGLGSEFWCHALKFDPRGEPSRIPHERNRMKLFTADDPKDSSAIQLFHGLLDSLGEPMIDSYLGSLLEKGDSPRSIGHSIGNQISSRIKDLNTRSNGLNWEVGSLKAQIAAE